MTISFDIDCEKRMCGNCHCNDSSSYCGAFGKYLKSDTREIDGSFIGYLRLDECIQAQTGERYSVTISRPINGISINGNEYVLDEKGTVLEFLTFNDALEYLVNRNYTLQDILKCKFIHEAVKETP